VGVSSINFPGDRVQKRPNITITELDQVYEESFTDLCYYLIAKFGIDLSDAEDAVNTAIVRIAQQKNGKPVLNLKALLYKVSANIIIDGKRHKSVRDSYLQNETSADDNEKYVIAGPEQIHESRQQLSRLVDILRAMAPLRRKLLLMHRFEGLSYAEIARRVGLAESTVREHVFGGVEECRLKLQKQAMRNERQ